MRILTVLTYYRPHTSGLTLYAERLAKALVQRGHQVTILTTRHQADSPLEAWDQGARIVRSPVLLRVSKGVISLALYRNALRLLPDHDLLLLHLPQFDGAGMALLGRLRSKPVVIAYHCDLQLPAGLFNGLVNRVVLLMNDLAGRLAQRVVAYTEDFAGHSPFLSRLVHKRAVILPPVELPTPSPTAVADFRERHAWGAGQVIGMATRFASEKGIEILLAALPAILQRCPDARVLFAGQYRDVWGEQAYFDRLQPIVEGYVQRGQFRFLGVLDAGEMGAFYENLDVLVVPSLNATESFGLVQIEAMQCGCPTVASNLPGVREPVRLTGMGLIVPIGDAPALARAVLQVLEDPGRFRQAPPALHQLFLPENCAVAYERLFSRLTSEAGSCA